MFNEFQQRLAQAGFIACPITAQEYDMLLASGLDDAGAEDVASDVAAGFTLEEACDAAF